MKKIIFSLITLFCCLAATAQSITVKSHVVDAQTGEDLPYVSIYASQDNGTLTNYEGDFTIEVDSTAVLRLSCVGYQEIQIKAIEAKKTIKMTPLTHSMREVQVRAWPNTVLQVAKKLNKEYESKKGKKYKEYTKLNEHAYGSGLGLNICKQFVEKHGGEIGLISELGHGSTFYCRFKTVENV